jgi:hypothetical protein
MIGETRMTLKRTTISVMAALSLAALMACIGNAQQVAEPQKVVQLTGLTGVRDNTKGTLSVESGYLHFIHNKASADLSAASILVVATGTDSRKSVGKTIGMASMAAPYGGGRFLSLFRTKIDTLTVQYRDADGGLHGAIFTMPAGAADRIKKDLVAQGAHTTTTGESTPAAPAPSCTRPNKEQQR